MVNGCYVMHICTDEVLIGDTLSDCALPYGFCLMDIL